MTSFAFLPILPSPLSLPAATLCSMKLIHTDGGGFSQLIRHGVVVLRERAELKPGELLLFSAPADYPRYPFHVVIAARFGDWVPLKPERRRKPPEWALLPATWWALREPFTMKQLALSGRDYELGTIVDVHDVDAMIIRKRGVARRGPAAEVDG